MGASLTPSYLSEGSTALVVARLDFGWRLSSPPALFRPASSSSGACSGLPLLTSLSLQYCLFAADLAPSFRDPQLWCAVLEIF